MRGDDQLSTKEPIYDSNNNIFIIYIPIFFRGLYSALLSRPILLLVCNYISIKVFTDFSKSFNKMTIN